MRFIVLAHRYLGVAVGLLMLLWCLSGFVMMYQGYPHLSTADRLAGLPALQLKPSAARIPLDLADDARVAGFSIEMIATRPVLRVVQVAGRFRLFDLASGGVVDDVDVATALAVAKAYAAGHAIVGQPRELGLGGADQWTVEDADRWGPLHHIALGDAAGTELYVAASTGQAVQVTDGRSRFWSYLGAIPHWLYPLALRRHAALWDMVMVWTSLAGVFLTAIGLYVGVARFRRREDGRWSPFRGWFYWHHLAGLAFGVLALTWVASGLFTMNPWGFLDTSVGLAERARLAGDVTGADLKRFLAIAPALADGAVVRLESAPLSGQLFAMALTRTGESRRVDGAGAEHALTEPELKAAVAGLEGAAPFSFARQDREDAYYYSGYDHAVSLPAYRVDLAGRSKTTLYIDARTGRIVQALDDVARQSRWLRTGLHDWDFAGLRQRPVWDVVVLILLAGVTGLCAIGAWLAIQLSVRDIQALLFRRR